MAELWKNHNLRNKESITIALDKRIVSAIRSDSGEVSSSAMIQRFLLQGYYIEGSIVKKQTHRLKPI